MLQKAQKLAAKLRAREIELQQEIKLNQSYLVTAAQEVQKIEVERAEAGAAVQLHSASAKVVLPSADNAIPEGPDLEALLLDHDAKIKSVLEKQLAEMQRSLLEQGEEERDVFVQLPALRRVQG